MKLYIALDGDNVGTRLSELINEGNDLKVAGFAKGVADDMQRYTNAVKSIGATVLLCSGDSVLYTISEHDAKQALSLLDAEFCTYTIGVGRTIQEAHLMLNYGKFLGKNCTHTWKDSHPTWFSFKLLGFFKFAGKAIFKYWK